MEWSAVSKARRAVIVGINWLRTFPMTGSQAMTTTTVSLLRFVYHESLRSLRCTSVRLIARGRRP
jgi:hypothetical protein